MSWWAVVVPVLVGIAFVMLPGLALAYAARMRGVTALSIAPAFSLSVYAVLGVGFGVTHLTWNVATVAIAAIMVVAVVGAVVRWLTRGIAARQRDPRSVAIAGLIGAGIALITVGLRFGLGFGNPDNISQTFDANFHLNGVRYIIDTGDVNPLTFGDLQFAYHGYGSLYPNLWHMVASLIAEGCGASIPVSVNAFSIVIGGLVWPLSIVFLMRQILGARWVPILVAGTLSACFASFPLLLVTFGVLYPNFLGIALVPAGLGALVAALGFARRAPFSRAVAWVVLAVMLAGITLAHPNALVSLMVLSVPLLIAAAWRWVKGAYREHAAASRFVGAAAILLAVAAFFVIVFIKLRPDPAAASWLPSLGPRKALYEALFNAQSGAPAIAMSILVIVGLIAVIVARRNLWLIGSWAIALVLYIATAWLPVGALRFWITGTWYSDVNRLIALEPVVLVPLATIGVVWFGRVAASILRRPGGTGRSVTRGRGPVVTVTLGVLLVAFIGAQLGPSMTRETARTIKAYRLDANSPLLSADERSLIDRLPDEVPVNAMIAGDPWTGTALAWALANRRVLAPHIYSTWPPGGALILHSLRSATPDSAVCKAVRDLDVKYVLDFGTRGVFGPTGQYPGVHHLATSKAVSLIDSQGSAALYRITACG